jgi:hypothetical protein
MDKKAIIQALRDTAQSASNSAASNLSAPVDAIAWALRKAGLPIPENAVGGSDWMEKKGLTAPVKEGIPKMAGEVLGGLAPVVAVAKAPQIAAGANRMIDNAMAPATLGKQRGVVGFKYPQEEALATAQRNAAKPVSEGGLGLRPDNTPMERANAMGMEDFFHGTNKEFDAFDPSKTKFVKGVFATKNPVGASRYVEKTPGLPTKEEGGFVMPLMADIRSQVSPEIFNMNNIKNGLAEGKAVVSGDVVVMPDAKKIRSRFAAFDPMRRNESDLLGRADPALLGLLGIGTGAGVAAYNKGKE